ncbi:MAG: hypothetical protein AB1324_00670 [Candidatus Micrarchaeota archaeon]
MGCCGDGGHGSHGSGDAAGGINWVQVVAIGLIVLLAAGFIIGR